MRRRELMALAAGVAALTPPAVAAQQPDRLRHIGVLVSRQPEADARIAAFEAALRSLGWTAGRNLRIDYRRAEASRDGWRAAAREIVALRPELVVVQSTPATREVLALSRTLPLVFVHVSDPIGSGFVRSFAKPGGDATGFTDIEASLGGKWPQLLKEAAPGVNRAALLFNPETAPDRGEFFLGPFMAAAAPLGIRTMPAPVHDVHEIETALVALAAEPGGGLAVEAESFMGSHSSEIVELAGRFRIPAVYPYRSYVAKGGLMAYGTSSLDLFRRAAIYVNKILKGAKPADLPVEQPTKFELVVNLKTAKALGLTVPPSLLARADEVIE